MTPQLAGEAIHFRNEAWDLAFPHLPRPSPATWTRWAGQGLEYLRVGTRVATSAEAIKRFIDRRGGAVQRLAEPKPLTAAWAGKKVDNALWDQADEPMTAEWAAEEMAKRHIAGDPAAVAADVNRELGLGD